MKKTLYKIMKYTLLSLGAFVSLFPFLWMIIASTNKGSDILTGKMSVGGSLIQNIQTLLAQTDVPIAMINSLKIAIIGTILSISVCSLAAYGFEIYKNKHRDRIYTVMILSMMIPGIATVIPLFNVVAKFGIYDTHFAVIIPTISSIFLIFFFRQNFKSFPKELIDAARIDGCTEFKKFFFIVVPAMKATYTAAVIITFMSFWNSYMWPLIVIGSQEKRTMVLEITSLASGYTPNYGVISVALILTTLPIIIIFFSLQKYFVEGMAGSVK